MKHALVSTIVFLAAALSACGNSNQAKTEPTPPEPTPTEPTANDLCKAGDTKPDADGCNTCTCNESGQWGCTEMDCGEARAKASAEVCTKGDTKPAHDGCNTCRCEQDGTWSCTQLACGGS